MSAWVYPTTSANSAKVIDFGSGATLDNIYLGRSGTTGAIQLGVHDGTTMRTITSGANLVNNQWQHVAATVSSTGTGTVYHNGISVISGSVGIPRNTTRLNNYIGKSNNAAHSLWAGGQDEVAVYRTALSATRVKAHYEAGTSSLLARRVSATGVQSCENRLGIEDWWQYVERKVGPGGMAKVNVSNGNLVLQQEDGTRSQAHGHLALSFRRTYNSLDTGRLTLPNSLGTGWTLDIGQVGAVTGSAMTAGALYVPPPTSALDQVLQALPVTLIDRDGTRHQFQPKRLSAVVTVPAVGGGTLAPRALVRGGVGLCVDQTYNAPPGVYVSMWRYVQVNGGDCSNVTASTSQVLGYGGIRSDRLRYEFSATGELLSMTDASGVELRYVYDAVPVLPAGGLPATLGRLRAVFESTAPSCKKLDGTVPTTVADVPSVCRALRLTWTGAPNASQVAVVDAAGRTTTYLLTATSPNYLMGVDNPDGTTVRYTYQGVTWNGVTGGCFSTVTGQLCTTTDLKSQTTTVNYRAASIDGFNSSQRPVVRTLADRKGNTVTFAYNSGTSTYADMATRRQRFDKIDAFGRVGAVNEGSDTNVFLKQTFYAWDGVADPTRQTPDVATPDPTRVGCRSDDKGAGHAGNVVANNLCRKVRKAVVTSQYPFTTARSTTAADEDRRFLY
ncbi:MAG TPA: LamG-like jellyroll fold domain-containing protein, partial [Acidimicrobiales bacterium]